MPDQSITVANKTNNNVGRKVKELFTLSRFRHTAASARLLIHTGITARTNFMELKMAIVVKAWK